MFRAPGSSYMFGKLWLSYDHLAPMFHLAPIMCQHKHHHYYWALRYTLRKKFLPSTFFGAPACKGLQSVTERTPVGNWKDWTVPGMTMIGTLGYRPFGPSSKLI